MILTRDFPSREIDSTKTHSLDEILGNTRFPSPTSLPVILCVDDEKIILDSLKSQLKAYFNNECRVELAESGEEALEVFKDLVKSGEGYPHVVISDQIMPGMKGDDFLARVNKLSPECLKILLTGQADKDHIISAINSASLYRYIAKPWDQMDLNMTVKEALLSYQKNMEIEAQRDQLLILNHNLEEKVTERTKDLARQKEISDSLLHNILPEEVVKELKEKHEVEPRHYDLTTVAFIDIVGFTLHGNHLSPHEMIEELNIIFNEIDRIVDKFDLEKIKTMGDGYLLVGGIPTPDTDNPMRVTSACLEIIQKVQQIKSANIKANLPPWDIRIGVHSGELVAGVIGKKKFAYDVWGSTVNTASRVEAASEPGKLNVSKATYELIKGHFICEERGKIAIKNMNEMEMYFVTPGI